MDQAARWLPDPEREGEERYWNGSAWTDRVRPAGRAMTLRLPEHVPELQRALSAATADIDAVEDRLSTLFDRPGKPGGTEKARGTGTPARTAPPCPTRSAVAPPGGDGASEFDVEVFFDFEVDESADDLVTPAWRDEGGGEPDDAFAELDAALAAEQPEHTGDPANDDAASRGRKGLFRRRS